MKHLHLVAVLTLMLAGSPAADEVYKWVDGDGNVHYADRPPADAETADSLSLPPVPRLDANHDQRSLKRRRLLEAFEAERAERQRLEAEAAQAKHERAEKCDEARRMLANVERANVLYTADEDGGRIYMGDEERRRATSDLRAWIREHCD